MDTTNDREVWWTQAQWDAAVNRPGGEYPGQPVSVPYNN